VSDQWNSFREPNERKTTDPARILSTSSENRWTWWREALGAFSDRPVGGWGAGSFAVVHERYRERYMSVGQPHSVPLQFLAETGLVGALLGVGGLVLLIVAAVRAVRARAGAGRGLAAALAGASVAWLLHGTVDWDWSIPGVVLPAMAFLGVVLGRPEARPVTGHWSPAARAAGLATVTLFMCAVAMSAALPGWADSKTSEALVRSSSSHPLALRQAAQEVELASRLDPLSPRPLIAAATIAERRGDQAQARRYLLRALARQPDLADTWYPLAQMDFAAGDLEAVEVAIRRVLALDPRNPAAHLLAESVKHLLAAPNDSATATGTPLPTFVQPSTAGTGATPTASPPVSGTPGAAATAGSGATAGQAPGAGGGAP
jgi:hypothetical protein